MSNYRRHYHAGGMYFFTVNLLQRHENDLLIRHIDDLRQAIRTVKAKHPFDILAWVVLPEHMHCIWQLPPDDDNFSTRWRLIKINFSKAIDSGERRSASRIRRGERGIWQRRYWEHLIRDELDLRRHMDYIHYNPVKHGLVVSVQDWEYSTFHHWVDKGIYSIDWCENTVTDLIVGEGVD